MRRLFITLVIFSLFNNLNSNTITSYFIRKDIDPTLKSHDGWIRVLLDPNKREYYGMKDISDDNISIMIKELKQMKDNSDFDCLFHKSTNK